MAWIQIFFVNLQQNNRHIWLILALLSGKVVVVVVWGGGGGGVARRENDKAWMVEHE